MSGSLESVLFSRSACSTTFRGRSSRRSRVKRLSDQKMGFALALTLDLHEAVGGEVFQCATSGL
jgi:hypothetical protein